MGAAQPAGEIDSADVLLAQCRSELAEKLDDLTSCRDGGLAGTLAAVWMGAPLDGAAAGVERRDAGVLRRTAGRGSDSRGCKAELPGNKMAA